jgi:hypothetical protein
MTRSNNICNSHPIRIPAASRQPNERNLGIEAILGAAIGAILAVKALTPDNDCKAPMR